MVQEDGGSTDAGGEGVDETGWGIFRLKHDCGAALHEIARSVGLARSTVRALLDRVGAAGLRWPLPQDLSDTVLEAMLYGPQWCQTGVRRRREPDWSHVHRELGRPDVTLTLLWQEERAATPDGYG